MRLRVGNLSGDEVERLITPAFVWASKSDGMFKAYGFGIGWWRYGFQFVWSRKIKFAPNHKETKE